MKNGRIDIITMGCSKNMVDSERLHRQLRAKGWQPHHNSSDVNGEYVIVNTCGFIGDAKQESIDMIISLIDLKQSGDIGKIIVMGCLSERYRKELIEELPEVDMFFGKFDWNRIIDILPDLSTSGKDKNVKIWQRDLSTPPWSAYIKISEGCDRMCSYCAIPLITGRHKSRSIEEILCEVKELADSGVREFNIIAQDLSAYGTDISSDGKSLLAQLIDLMAEISGVKWIRLHYAYPADFPYDVLEVMRHRENVCNYLDIALQHISDSQLAKMHRNVSKQETIDLISRIRQQVPDIRLRTTLMVGFPGESEEDFQELVQFVRETKFDRMGAFKYSEEENTWAQRNLTDDVDESVKDKRLDILMTLQEEISGSLHSRLKGNIVEVLVESVEENEAFGRTEWDSPEVDPEVIISIDGNKTCKPGEFVKVRITDTEPFLLYGELL